MRVRHAEADRDASACAEIYAPFVLDTAISFEEQPPTEAEMRRRMEEIAALHPWLVAEADGRVVGYAYASPHRVRAAYRWATDVTIYIDPGHQGQGIGRALYENLFEVLQEQGYRMAVAGITLPNPASVALHRALGFTAVGVYRQVGWKHGAWHDVAWYQRALGTERGSAPSEPKAPARRT